eukprot:94726_1
MAKFRSYLWKYWPIPEEGIINEFLQARKFYETQFSLKIKQRVPCALLSYFGMYEHIIVNKHALTLHEYSYCLVEAILALEAYGKVNMDSLQMQNLFCAPFAFIGLYHYRFKYSKFIFTAFLKYYKRFAGKSKLQLNSLRYNQYCARIWLAYIMMFYHDIILKELKAFKKSQNITVKPNMIKAMKKWTAIDIIAIGVDHYSDTVQLFYKFLFSSDPNAHQSKVLDAQSIFLIIGLTESRAKQDINSANKHLAVAICLQTNHYLRVVGLLQLCSNCYLHQQYFIG